MMFLQALEIIKFVFLISGLKYIKPESLFKRKYISQDPKSLSNVD